MRQRPSKERETQKEETTAGDQEGGEAGRKNRERGRGTRREGRNRTEAWKGRKTDKLRSPFSLSASLSAVVV